MGYEVTAISSSPGKQTEALAWGAEKFIDISDKTALEQAEFYFDSLLITSHGGIPWGRLLEMLKKKGKVILAAFPHVDFGPVDLVTHELSIVTAFLGRREEMREMLRFAVLHDIKPMIELMQLSQVNQAIERLRQNKARYRIVLVNDII